MSFFVGVRKKRTQQSLSLLSTTLPFATFFPSSTTMLLLILPLLSLLLHPCSALNQEGLYLLQAKLSFSDPDSALSSWSPRGSATPCSWYGVQCDPTSLSVTAIDLSNTNISGPLPSSLLCRLQNLTSLSLSNNFINSTLPSDLSTCRNLIHLDLSQNLLTGTLPHTLPLLSNLKYLDLTANNFSGQIPDTFGSFRNLEVLSLVYNLLDGVIPPFLGNITTLKMLNLSYNPFHPGRIPAELGNLSNLEILWLTECNLVGEIPDSLGRLTKLTDLDLAINNLVGKIPSSLTGLLSVIQIELYNNSLTGELPSGLGRLTQLRLLDASMNQLSGPVPDELCSLQLESLNLYENRFTGTLPASIANSRGLYELRLFHNQLTGELPKNLGKNSPLKWLDVSNNHFTGQIPAGLCDMGRLEEVLLIYNSLAGGIPESLGQCQGLTRVRLGHNNLSGEVPVGFWGLPHVYLVDLVNNSLSGQISKTIASAANLSVLLLSNNGFSGNIPEEIGWLENLQEISARGNRFMGPLPGSIVHLRTLGRLDLHGNLLSGELPSGIDGWNRLNELNLGSNALEGRIPDGIGKLPLLNYLDLSSNRFCGRIPASLQNLKLNQLNLSNNRLSGAIPPMYAKEMYKSSFVGNPGLCGDIAGLCDGRDGEGRGRGYVWLLRSIFVLAGLVLVVGVVMFYVKYRNFKMARAVDKSKWTLMSFHKLGFSEDEIMDCLDEDNVIGSGSSGKVYKVVLANGDVVAVKKLWGGVKKETTDDSDIEKGPVRDDGFEAEVGTLGKIRHKNIVKLWCCCTTRDCKLLVYEYMSNGSLGDLLHRSKGGSLAWPTRFKIILDAAEGLSYLHHDCVPAIVHRDVKSNNILLDEDFGARIADFGVAKVVDSSGKPKSMSVIAGSCGYIAPEYGYTLRVNEKSDIYSFGVVMLELVTGRRAVDPEFGEKDLVKWACTTFSQKGVEHVIDSKLDSCFSEEISKVLNIGLHCTSPLPINRPSMRRVVKMLQEIGAENQLKSAAAKKDGKLTPYYYEDASGNGSVS